MAKAREIKRRIKGVSSTQKITRTMEMIATAKSKVTQNRLRTLLPYADGLAEMTAGLVGTVPHPLLQPRDEIRKVVLMVLSSNRGLCGGYNTNIINLAREVLTREQEAGREVELVVSGKKGIGFFQRQKVTMAKTYTHFEDRVTFEEADALAEPWRNRYLTEDIDRVILVSCRYHSSGVQKPGEVVLLPLEKKGGDESSGVREDYIYEPDPKSILDGLLPLSVSVAFLQALAEATGCEQIARRVAMKLATDNADELLRFLTRNYNRARQSQITQELSEIMGGAEALA